MKKRSGCFSRILVILIVLGIIGAVGLCYLGYDKANHAEAAVMPAEELRSAYLQDGSISADPALWEELLATVIGDEKMMADITAILGNNTMAEMIVKNCYLPDDEAISTAIAQKILTHRLSKTYNDEELLAIYCGMMGYDPTSAANLSKGSQEDHSLISDIIRYLAEQGIFNENTIAELEQLLQ